MVPIDWITGTLKVPNMDDFDCIPKSGENLATREIFKCSQHWFHCKRLWSGASDAARSLAETLEFWGGLE